MAAVLKTARGGDTPPGFESLALRIPSAKRPLTWENQVKGRYRMILDGTAYVLDCTFAG
jgi:hypothetical protein